MITYLTLQPRESKKGSKTQILIHILLIKLFIIFLIYLQRLGLNKPLE